MNIQTGNQEAIVQLHKELAGSHNAAAAAPTAVARWSLVSLALPTFMASLDTSIANAGLPTLAHAFGATFQQVQWIVLAYLLAITTLIVSAGRLGDLIGRRRLLLAGIGLFALASLACGVAPRLDVLIAARAAQGMGAAIMIAVSLALVGETATGESAGRTIGLLGSVSAIGTALGPSLGGLLISGVGWRAIFLVNLPVGLLAIALAHRHLPEDRLRPQTERTTFDGLGTLLLAATLAAYALAMTIGHGRFGMATALLLAVSLLGLATFVLVESRLASPLLPMAMLHDPVLGASLAMNLLVSAVVMSTLVVGPFYLAMGLGLDAASVGLLLSIGPVVVALMGVPAGRLAGRFGARPLAGAGLVGIAAGSLLLSLLPTGFGLLGYVPSLVLLTAGYAVFQTANSTAVMTGGRSVHRGVISGLLNLSRHLGLITGASVMGAVFAMASGASDISRAHPSEVATGMKVTFAVAAALMLVAIAISSRVVVPPLPSDPGGAS